MLIRKCIMRKKLVYVFAPLALGLLTGAFHLFEMRTVFADGVLQNPTPLTAVVIIMTVLSVAFFAVSAMKEPAGADVDTGYAALYPSQTGYVILDSVLGLSFVSAALWLMLYGEKTAAEWILIALCALTGMAAVCTGFAVRKGKDGALIMLCSVIPALFFAYLMALTYRDWSGSPSVLRYCWQISAFGIAAVYYVTAAGFAFRRGSRRGEAFFSMLSVFLLTVLLFEGGEAWRMAVSCAALIGIMLSCWKRTEKSL